MAKMTRARKPTRYELANCWALPRSLPQEATRRAREVRNWGMTSYIIDARGGCLPYKPIKKKKLALFLSLCACHLLNFRIDLIVESEPLPLREVVPRLDEEGVFGLGVEVRPLVLPEADEFGPGRL